MKRTVIVVLIVLILLIPNFCEDLHVLGSDSDDRVVRNVSTGINYTSIQNAISASETLNGHTIIVEAGTYNEHVTVDKSLSILGDEGAAAVVDGGGGGIVIHVTASNVLIRRLTVKGGFMGIYLDHSNNSTIVETSVSDTVEDYAIYVSYSDDCTIEGNNVGPNACSGILVTNSMRFQIVGNIVHENTGYGINANASMNGVIMYNDASMNSYDGIGLGEGCSNCTVLGNNVTHNELFGVWLDSDSVDNLIFDNNIINNSMQASVNLANNWDNGFEGNYWSDYSGVDADQNGIGDEPKILRENNTDNYPLLGTFSLLKIRLGLDVTVISNSSIMSFAYFESNTTLRLNVVNRTMDQGGGFCRVRIPHALMVEPYIVTVEGANPPFWNYSIYDDGSNRWIYHTYAPLQQEILISGQSAEDNVAPVVVVYLPESKVYNVTSVPLVFEVNEQVSWMAYSLDGGANVTILGNTTLVVESEGLHTFVVYAKDMAGNVGVSNVVSFEISSEGESPFAYWVVAVAVAAAVFAVSLLVYRRKRSRQPVSSNAGHVTER